MSRGAALLLCSRCRGRVPASRRLTDGASMGHDCKGSAPETAVGADSCGRHVRKVAQVGRFISGIFADRAQAQKVIHTLIESGISSRQISLAVREPRSEDVARRDKEE